MVDVFFFRFSQLFPQCDRTIIKVIALLRSLDKITANRAIISQILVLKSIRLNQHKPNKNSF
ncbi:MAG TPA: hypothetical protein DCY88_30645 [Cyanobacteria bacterium UBA11372]|nr:hypothetical protein [Cyanobacteria bacterium UBA11372]